MKLTKIHKVLKFKQSDWIKKYVDFSNEERINSAYSFDENFLKFMINSLYGKAIENLRKRINVGLVNNEKDFLKYTSKANHMTHKTFGKNYVAIHEIKPVLTLNKQIYVGFTVLELSKWLIYEFHYIFIKKNTLMLNCYLLTQIKIKSEDVYEEFFKHKHLFDFSNFSKDFKFYDILDKMVFAKIKDEYKEIRSINLLN